MDEILTRSLTALSARRPVFHSEADFQFALAWEIKTIRHDADVRLEVPVGARPHKFRLDLRYVVEEERTAVELKYFKAPLKIDWNGETFELADAVAQDINRYDFLKDVQRLEKMLAADLCDAAYGIVLTNQPKYWLPRTSGNRVDEEFGIEDGRLVTGTLKWAPHTGGTSRGRETPITLCGEYRLQWGEYSTVRDPRFGRFRILCVRASRGVLEAADPTDPASERPARAKYGKARKYDKWAELLDRSKTPTVVLRMAEIEEAIGALPESARKHRAWWGNDAGHAQATWLKLGWKVQSVDLADFKVTFEKSESD